MAICEKAAGGGYCYRLKIQSRLFSHLPLFQFSVLSRDDKNNTVNEIGEVIREETIIPVYTA